MKRGVPGEEFDRFLRRGMNESIMILDPEDFEGQKIVVGDPKTDRYINRNDCKIIKFDSDK